RLPLRRRIVSQVLQRGCRRAQDQRSLGQKEGEESLEVGGATGGEEGRELGGDEIMADDDDVQPETALQPAEVTEIVPAPDVASEDQHVPRPEGRLAPAPMRGHAVQG